MDKEEAIGCAQMFIDSIGAAVESVRTAVLVRSGDELALQPEDCWYVYFNLKKSEDKSIPHEEYVAVLVDCSSGVASMVNLL